MLMAFPYLLVPENEQQEIMRGGREEAEEAEVAEQRNVQDRVEGWISQVNAVYYTQKLQSD